MTHEEIAKLFAEFEKGHAVETYQVHGVHVWPLVRTMTAMRGIQGDVTRLRNFRRWRGLEGKYTRTRTRALRVFRMLRNAYRSTVASFPPVFHRRHQWSIPPGGFPAAIITNSERVIPWGDVWIHPLADPLVDLLSMHDLQPCIWEQGKSPGPRLHSPHLISEFHRHKYRLASKQLPNELRCPEWFAEVNAWTRETLNLDIGWHEFGTTIRHVLALSRVFEEWMKHVDCRLVFLDCWYAVHSLAASLAANRRGIPSVEFQHGVQGEANANYSFWTRAPEQGYEMMPRWYWVWGESGAAAILAHNDRAVVQKSKVLVGGNLWINRWRRDQDPRVQEFNQQASVLSEGFARTILITLQTPFIEYSSWLLDAIRKSPPDWRWLVRLHLRHAGSRKDVFHDFLGIGHPGVEIEQSSSLPVYALLQHCDYHITGYSTCALEALRFGIPSLLTHPTGWAIYRPFIEQGAMNPCRSAGEILEHLRESGENFSTRIHEAAERAFASESAADDALQRLERLSMDP